MLTVFVRYHQGYELVIVLNIYWHPVAFRHTHSHAVFQNW